MDNRKSSCLVGDITSNCCFPIVNVSFGRCIYFFPDWFLNAWLCKFYVEDSLTLFETLVIRRYTMGNFVFIDEDFRFVVMWRTIYLMPLEWFTLFINLLLTNQILATTAFSKQSHPEDWRVWPRTKFLVNILRGFRCFNTYLLGSVSCDITCNSRTDLDRMAKNFQTIGHQWANNTILVPLRLACTSCFT